MCSLSVCVWVLKCNSNSGYFIWCHKMIGVASFAYIYSSRAVCISSTRTIISFEEKKKLLPNHKTHSCCGDISATAQNTIIILYTALLSFIWHFVFETNNHGYISQFLIGSLENTLKGYSYECLWVCVFCACVSFFFLSLYTFYFYAEELPFIVVVLSKIQAELKHS